MRYRIYDPRFAVIGVLHLDQPEVRVFAVRQLDAVDDPFGENEAGACVWGAGILAVVEERELDGWEFVGRCGGTPGTADGAEAADVDIGCEAFGDLVEKLRWKIRPWNVDSRVCTLHFL